MEKKPYKLAFGIHQNTIISRDVGEEKTFDTRDEAIAEINRLSEWYKTLGYILWFANIWSFSQGEYRSENIVSNPCFD
jgi:hypothetical protein